jgi:hypothetical protein
MTFPPQVNGIIITHFAGASAAACEHVETFA